MNFNKSFKEITSNYEYFVFDVWGVIHDGVHAYPNATQTIIDLKREGKKICFLSNAPRRAFKVAEVLKKYGIEQNYYDFILTSGEATFIDLEKNQKNNFKNFGKKYFYIGPEKDLDLLEGLDYEMVKSAKEANFAITTGFDHDHSVIEEKMSQIVDAVGEKLPLICVNPDMMVIRKSGEEMLCAGVIAKKYEELLGSVIYYGKPHLSVYNMTHELFGKNIEKKKILAIGDGLETDIKGANNFEIDSVLITSGILSNKLGVKYNQNADEDKVKYHCELQNAFPKYVIPNL